MKKLDESIYVYSKFKEYVRDWMKQNKISVRKLGAVLNMTSMSYLNALISNDIRGSVSGLTVDNLCRVMKLDKEESIYFRLLILLHQSRITNFDQNMSIINAISFWLTGDRLKLMQLGIGGEIGNRSNEKITYKRLRDLSLSNILKLSGGIIKK